MKSRSINSKYLMQWNPDLYIVSIAVIKKKKIAFNFANVFLYEGTWYK